MRLTKKQLAGGLAAVVVAAAGGAVIGIASSPDAGAHPGHSNCDENAQRDHPCDPLTFILGPESVPASGATTWQDLLMPPEAGPRP